MRRIFTHTSLGKGRNDDSLERATDIRGELLMIWGRQDPHTPLEGRMVVLARLNEVGALFNWHEVNGAHAFLRDEGARYDPELARQCMGLALDLFHRKLGLGDFECCGCEYEYSGIEYGRLRNPTSQRRDVGHPAPCKSGFPPGMTNQGSGQRRGQRWPGLLELVR